MTNRDLWQITMRAVRDYLAIQGFPDATDGVELDRAKRELSDMARWIVDGGKEGKPLDVGGYLYRGPRPLRLRLIVHYDERQEGALVQVMPEFDGRRASEGRGRSR